MANGLATDRTDTNFVFDDLLFKSNCFCGVLI